VFWWGVKGVIHWELLPDKNTVTETVYRAQISSLKELVDIVGPRGPKVYFQHDNARPHVSETVRRKLDELGWKAIPHPPYSSDLAPFNYHLFLSLSNHLRAKNFRDEEELKSFIQSFFDSKPREFHAKGIRYLPRRWAQVIDSKSAYVHRN
jgi:histone-lysine N-methyltransferase SETMAR